MSIMRDGRDTAASLFYLQCLDRQREEHLKRVLRGEKIAPDFWTRAEGSALEQTRQQYFNKLSRAAFLSFEKAAAMNDQEDFAARSTQLVEMAMLDSHRALVKIPCMGLAEYSDAPN